VISSIVSTGWRFRVCTYLQSGYTPLYRAAYKGHIEVVRHLISSGADVNKADNVSARLHWLW